ncbi:hypothetical protein [Paenibacillus sp. FSL R7-0652]|uniref:hypothetical protein n=1 Tax=Paenibacillus sp. FSL R7-0652 TaxID=2921687 RepID=UPI00315ABA2C
MEKINTFQPKQLPEYTCLDDRRIELHSVIRSMIKETAYQKDYIWNTSPIHICSPDSAHTDSSGSVLQNKNADHLELVDLKTDMANRARRLRQNVWNSRVLKNGARNQRWFDKLQDYRNGV